MDQYDEAPMSDQLASESTVAYTLPNGDILALAPHATGADAAAAIGPGLARAALAAKVDGVTYDLARELPTSGERRIEIITERSGDAALELIRHDTAHVLAAAMLELYPGVKISIGPAIDNGFYYDFDFPEGVNFSDADFPAVEAKMREHVKADEVFTREDISTGEALERFAAEEQPYKVELIEDLIKNARADAPVESVSLYTNGPFTDLCRGPHAPSTKRIKAFKLQSVAGAYWRGDSSRQMLTRVYGDGVLLPGRTGRLPRAARARSRQRPSPPWRAAGHVPLLRGLPGDGLLDPGRHRGVQRTGEAEPGDGLRAWLSGGQDPQIFDSQLWKTSGHWDKYGENMFVTEYEERVMAVKPMNCPGHCQLYLMTPHSYRELPLRLWEPGLLHRLEPSGTLHGLLRVRHFAQDDSHIFCTEDQIQDEVAGVLGFAFDTYKLFGLDVHLELSTRPEQRVGSDELWDQAEGALAAALDHLGLSYDLNPGDGAFYGPKIDIHMTDSLGRSWQLGTCQLDFNFPARFELSYVGADNAEHRPVMIHRALMGSYERFIGILLEHFSGELPLWLAPAPGDRAADRRPAQRLRRRGGRRAEGGRRPRRVGWTAPSPSGARSATRSWPRSPSCS